MITAKQIRQSIAGYETKNVLVSDGGYQLVHSITYKGWFDEALSVDSFIIQSVKTGIKFVSSHATLQEALEAWDKLPPL